MDNTNDFEIFCLQLITFAGEAKSNYMEALEAAKDADYEGAEELMKKGDSSFAEGHKMHTELIQKECGGEKVIMTLLLTHVEDQLSSAENTKTMVREMILLYQKLNKQGR